LDYPFVEIIAYIIRFYIAHGSIAFSYPREFIAINREIFSKKTRLYLIVKSLIDCLNKLYAKDLFSRAK